MLLRGVQSLGAACVLSVTAATTRLLFPDHLLGRGFAISGIVISGATAFAPTISGFIISVASWRWVFAATLPFALGAWLLGRRLPQSVMHSRAFDWRGAVLCALFLGLLLGGLEMGLRGIDRRMAFATLALGLVISVAFTRRSLPMDHPILPVDLLRQPVVALSISGSQLAFIASMLLTLTLPFRFQREFGFSPASVGALIAPWPLTMLILSPPAVALSDRYHAGLLGFVGMASASIGMAELALLPESPGYWNVAWRMALIGAGFSIYMGSNARLVIGSVAPARAAHAGALITTNRLLGQTIGATLAAFFMAHAFPGRAPAITSASLAAAAALCSLSRIRRI